MRVFVPAPLVGEAAISIILSDDDHLLDAAARANVADRTSQQRYLSVVVHIVGAKAALVLAAEGGLLTGRVLAVAADAFLRLELAMITPILEALLAVQTRIGEGRLGSRLMAGRDNGE